MLKNLVYLAIFTSFVVLVWMILSIYHNVTSSTISTTISTQIAPLAPSFDVSAIDNLKKRAEVSSNRSETITFPSVSPGAPSPSLTPAPSRAPSITISPTQSSSSSGTLSPL